MPKTKKKCKICKSIFEFYIRSDKPDRLFCSNKCKFQYQQNHPPKQRTGTYRQCEVCNLQYYVQKYESSRRFCSKQCTDKAKVGTPLGGDKKRHTYSFRCKNCNINVDNQQLSRVKTAKFCSYSCRAVFYAKKGMNESSAEKKFRIMLENNGVSYVTQYVVENKIFDFYIPHTNTLIEIDGIFWHAKDYRCGKKSFEELYFVQQKVVKNDKVKDMIARKIGLNLIRIWEDEVENYNLQSVL